MSKKIRYAVVGCGSFSRNHLRALIGIEDVEIVAFMDKHIEQCEAKKKLFELEDVRCYNDHNEMLAKEDIDVVTVVTSDREHKQATIDALRAGCHVVCEKPMSLFVDDCVEMVKTADETGKLLLVGQVCRYAPGFMKAKELIDSGVIGELYYVESEYAHDYQGREGTDGWRTDVEREPIIGGACHAIDLLRWLAGDPVETTAYSNHKNLLDWPINDTTVAIMKFPNNVIGKVFTSIGCKRDYTMRTVLYGTKGTIICDNTSPEITLFLEQIDGAPFAAGQISDLSEKTVRHMIKVEIANHNVREEHKSMIAAIREGKPIKTTGREGARTVCVCRAVVESAKTGKTVEIKYPV
jgi:predicted dehydrogenase